MSEDNDRMEALVAAFVLQAPSPWIVNRDFFGSWENADQQAISNGIFSFVSAGTGRFEKFRIQGSPQEGPHKFLIVGRKALSEDAGGKEVEEAEFDMLERVKQFFLREDLPSVIEQIRITDTIQSKQVEAPHCWIVVEAEIELEI